MKISVINRDGTKHILEADNNSTLMEVIRDEGLDIEAACGQLRLREKNRKSKG